jgi:hypothetical protein
VPLRLCLGNVADDGGGGMEAGETRASEGRGRPGAGTTAPHGDGRGLGLERGLMPWRYFI